jgi:transcriptional regulator with XRE-family HTH domain
MENWNERLTAHLSDRGLTHAALAEKMKVSAGTISHWLTKRRAINLDDFIALCRVAKADPQLILFGRTETQALVGELRTIVRDYGKPKH